MTDIAKLKQEAEEARKAAIKEIRYTHTSDFYDPSAIADSLIAATIAQIALQAAEKEAEAQKHRVDVANATMQFGLACKKEPRLEKAFIGAMLSVREKFGTDPAPIADNCARSHPHEDMTPECEKKSIEAKAANVRLEMQNIVHVEPAPIADGWIRFEGTERPTCLGARQWVSVKTQGGMISNWYAGYMSWSNPTGIECNKIIAYRIIQPAADRVPE